MKKFHTILALLLIAALLGMLCAACANGDTADQGGSTDVGNPGEGSGPANQQDASPAEDEVVTIVLYVAEGTGCSEFSDHVVEAMNELTVQKIGVSVDWHYITFGNYGTEVNMTLAGGDRIDVLSMY